jgi:hypothetical protein
MLTDKSKPSHTKLTDMPSGTNTDHDGRYFTETELGGTAIDLANHNHDGGDGGQIDHGALSGRGDDDHTQYLLADGTRDLSGDWAIAANNVTLTAGTLTAEQITSTDDMTMLGHLLTLGDGSANDIVIKFDGSAFDTTLTFDESVGSMIFDSHGRTALQFDHDVTHEILGSFDLISLDFDMEYNYAGGVENLDVDIYGSRVIVTNYTDFDHTGYDAGYMMQQWGSYNYVIDRANYTGEDEEYGPRLKQVGMQNSCIATEGQITAEEYAFVEQYGTYSFVQNAKALNNANTTATSLQYGNYMTVSAMTLQDIAGTYNVTQYGNYMSVQPPQPGNVSGTTRCYGDYINFSAAGPSNVDYLYILYLKAGNPIPTPSNWYALYSDTTVKSLFKGPIWIDNDDKEFIWGAGQDGSIYYDGTDLVCNPQEQGTGRFKIQAEDAATNAVTYINKLAHLTSNTATVGFGVAQEWVLHDSVGNEDASGIIENLWTDAVSGSEDADFIFKLMDGGAAAAERARLTSDGDFKITNDFYANNNQGLTGTLTLDDGSNWRITLTFTGGILTGQTTGASSAAAATWV